MTTRTLWAKFGLIRSMKQVRNSEGRGVRPPPSFSPPSARLPVINNPKKWWGNLNRATPPTPSLQSTSEELIYLNRNPELVWLCPFPPPPEHLSNRLSLMRHRDFWKRLWGVRGNWEVQRWWWWHLRWWLPVYLEFEREFESTLDWLVRN